MDTSHCGKWTPVELDLIRQIYPKGGANACALVMPNRTIKAIQRQASKQEVACEASKHCGRRSIYEFSLPVHDDPDAHREWQQIDRRIAAIPAANGPRYSSMGAAA